MGLSPVAHRLPSFFSVSAQRVRVWNVESAHWRRHLLVTILLLLFAALVTAEMRFSWMVARLSSLVATRVHYRMEAGGSKSVQFPQAGPYDLRCGYSLMPEFLERLQREGYSIEEQARDSGTSRLLTRWGIYPLYHEKNQTGLEVSDGRGRLVYQVRDPERIYADFDAIPPLAVQTLLFIENRHMLDPNAPNRNPAIEWGRLGHAVVDLGVHTVNPHHTVIGGSTLATQLEKIRHSPEGRTHSASEKLRQIASATLRSYQDGPRTLEVQRQIIRDYINSIPLAATVNHGEVMGLGDGLAVWYGADFAEVNRLLFSSEDKLNGEQMQERARAYRQVLSLFLALRRPSVYLVRDTAGLSEETDRYLRALWEGGVISARLRDAALGQRTMINAASRKPQETDFVARKTLNLSRERLLELLGLHDTYQLDHLDLSVQTTIDQELQQSINRFFEQVATPEKAAAAGLSGEHLLSAGDPGQVIYSFTLYERGAGSNRLIAQTDNLNQPLSVVEDTRLQLGSTAKLRTLINYLQVMEQLHAQYAGLSPAQLAAVSTGPGDRLTQWALSYLATAQDRSLETMLNAALDRKYSGSPGEVFFTAGGRHVFANFERSENSGDASVRQGFQQSINLVYIRVMRDIENYYKWRVPGASPAILEDANHPARARYLQRFADQEGTVFLSRFYEKYRGLTSDAAMELLLKDKRPGAVRAAVIYRFVRPEADLAAFTAFVSRHTPEPLHGNHSADKLYATYAPGKFNLADSGYLAGVHPLELWLLRYLAEHPQATFSQAIAASSAERQDVYRWLMRPKMRHGQDVRIGILLEQDAFREIWKAWRRVGYPFDALVPSYATAIGVSGDTPEALATLAGIVINGGVRYPTELVRGMQFAQGTPMETRVAFRPARGEAVLSPVIARLVYQEMLGVVQNGTGRRALRAFTLADGTVIPVAGKTGTGDNRFKVFAHGGGVVAERPVNRTATFVFILGDRLFGTVTAFVPGANASSYNFSSALAVQVLKDLAPTLRPLLSESAAVQR